MHPARSPPSYVAQASLLGVVPRWLERGAPVIRRKFLDAWTNHIPITSFIGSATATATHGLKAYFCLELQDTERVPEPCDCL